MKTLYQYSGSCWLAMMVEEFSRLTNRLNTWDSANAETSVARKSSMTSSAGVDNSVSKSRRSAAESAVASMSSASPDFSCVWG